MVSINKSGYYYPNKAGRVFLLALEEVMGKNGVSAILNLAGLESWIDNYPADDLERGIDFSDFSAINAALEELYGPRGGQGLARRAGWATFDIVLRNFGALAGISDMAFKMMPLATKIKISLPAIAKVFSQITDQEVTAEIEEDALIYTLQRCPVCWGRTAEKPVCYVTLGLLEESMRWISGGQDFSIQETKCIATGDDVCEFRIDKIPVE